MERNLFSEQPLWTNEFNSDEFTYVCQRCKKQYIEIGDFHHKRIYTNLCPRCEDHKITVELKQLLKSQNN